MVILSEFIFPHIMMKGMKGLNLLLHLEKTPWS
jgi:hypothetical protein